MPQIYLKQNFSKEMFLYFLLFNKAYKSILMTINLKSYKIYEKLTHKQIKKKFTLKANLTRQKPTKMILGCFTWSKSNQGPANAESKD